MEMKKLELKQLKGYLGTGLKVIDEESGKIFEVCGCDFSENELLVNDNIDGSIERYCLDLLKPLLLPLSALTEPLEDGSVPIIELVKMKCNWIDKSDHERIYIANSSPADGVYLVWFNTAYESDELLLCIEEYDIYSQRMSIIDKLTEWHFDIHGLIPAGLAIDKRTVK